MKRKITRAKRSVKAPSRKQDPFISGEWIILDKGKVDLTIRPSDINFRKLLKKFGYPLSLKKKRG